MRGKICNAAYGVALNLDVGRVHLLDERAQAAELNDADLVLGCETLARVVYLTAGRGTYC